MILRSIQHLTLFIFVEHVHIIIWKVTGNVNYLKSNWKCDWSITELKTEINDFWVRSHEKESLSQCIEAGCLKTWLHFSIAWGALKTLIAVCDHMTECWGHYAKWDNSETTNTVCSVLYVESKKAKLIEAKSRMVITRCQGFGEEGDVGWRVQTPSKFWTSFIHYGWLYYIESYWE